MKNTSKNPEESKEIIKPGILHDSENSDKILKMTSDTMFLLTKEGICVDMVIHTDRWFLQKSSYYIGKNIFELMPLETSMALKNNFDKVASTSITSTDNYEIQVTGKAYFFKCIMYDYDENHILWIYRDITQRILLKQRLEIMNLKLQEIEKVAQIGQWNFNAYTQDFQYAGFSGGLAKSNDFKTINILDYQEFVHPDDRESLLEFINNNLNILTDDHLDYRLSINDKLFYFRLKAISFHLEDGCKMIYGYVQNITDIMQKQRELEMVTLAVENSSEYIFAIKKDGQFIFANQKFKELNYWETNEDISKHNLLESNKREADKTRWMDIIHQLSTTKQTISFVIPKPIIDKPDILAFDCTSYLIQDFKGAELIWTFGKDITERVQYEKQVKELNQIMSTVLRNIPMTISVKDVDNDFKYIFSNRDGNDFNWGVKDGIIGKTDFEIYPAQIADKMRSEDLATVKCKRESRKIIEEKDENGKRCVKDQLRILVKDEIRPLLISIEREITKDKLMEQELINAKEKAEQSDKLKSAFIANMSHEIRTPLNAIIGFSRIIAETEDSEERQSYYNIVEDNNSRLLGLINEILDLSKIESGIMEFDYEPMSVYTICRDLIQNLSLSCSKDIELIFDKSSPDIIIKCDKNRLSQVFNNLVGNAIKFTKKGNITFGFKQKPNNLEFFVSDTGSGIPADKIDTVFERFVKADNFSQGTGLGLPICKSIIEKMGGDISVQSEFGTGTYFTFTLPNSCLYENISNNVLNETTQTEHQSNGETILVAEDTDSNYVLLEAMIGKKYNLIRANNGLEAVQMFEKFNPNLILIDIKMPVMNGLDATKIIRTISSKIPIIAQSAFAFEEDRKKAHESGCDDFLTKPFTKKQLLEAINKFLN